MRVAALVLFGVSPRNIRLCPRKDGLRGHLGTFGQRRKASHMACIGLRRHWLEPQPLGLFSLFWVSLIGWFRREAKWRTSANCVSDGCFNQFCPHVSH